MLKVNEIFYSLQGEGRFTGTPAVFLRLSGCNTQCPFCDTKHQTGHKMHLSHIMWEIRQYPSNHIVITGGEPVMQITSELTDTLHDEGYFIQIETNGSLPLPPGCSVDWITCSPKDLSVQVQHIDELKALFYDGLPHYPAELEDAQRYGIKHFSLQPLDTGNDELNKAILDNTINYILQHPKWNLSLQTHKLLNIQ